MTIFKKSLIYTVFLLGFLGLAGRALAYSPTLNVYSSTGGSTTISISGGQPDSTVVISYTPSGSSLLSSISGVTDYNGDFTTMINAVIGSQISATVGGQQVYANYNGGGCTYNCGTGGIGGLTLSQSSLQLNAGQSAVVTASYPIYGSGSYYISDNSNSSVASVSVSGSQITVYGIIAGTTNISICANSSSGVCASLYVSVSGSGSCGYNGCSGSLSLSQSSLSMTAGQSSTVTVYNNGYSGTPYVSSNSNSSVASASASGNSIYINALSAGSTNIYICQGGSSQCATLYVTVTGGYYGSGSIYFSPSSLSMTAGQSSTVSVYNSSNSYGSYYVSSNSNSSVASASISGSSLYVSALSSGSASIVVCESGYSSSCATLYVSVTGSVLGSNTDLWFSPGNPSLYVGQSLAVSINSSVYNNSTYSYSNNPYYISSNSNSSVVSASVSGTVLNLYGSQSGNSTITVCNSALGFCGTLYVTVGGSSSYGGSLSLSQTSVGLNVGQTAFVSANNASGVYVSSNSNAAAVSAGISGNEVDLQGLAAGSTTVYVCATNSQCAYIYVTVSGGYYGGSGSVSFNPSSANLSLGQSSYVTISSSYGSGYYVSSNSNSSVVSASVSGSSLYLYANSDGNSTITVCQSGYSACGTLYVTVGNGYSGGSLSLSQTVLNLGLGQSSTVSAYGISNGYYYVSSNSNAGVATANVSGSVITIYGQSAGSTTVVICQSNSNACANLSVIVGSGYYGNSSGSLSLNQSSLSLSSGQTASVSIYGNGGYYVSSNYNSSVASASISGNTVNVYGSSAGYTTIVICQNNPNSCTNLSVTVNGYAYSGGSGSLQYPGGSSGSGSSVLGASTYLNGELIGEGQAVYIVYKNTKTGFANAAAFTGLGFSFSNVLQVGSSGLASSGYIVTTPYAQHPWGTWIKNSGNTVYFVNDLGLIPIPDWSTFLNNGGQGNLIVNANSYDFKLPILSPMVSNDPRLK